MQDRNIICIYYEAKGQCSKGQNASIRGRCQHCTLYTPDPHATPFRYNTKQRKLNKIQKKEIE